MEAAHIRTVDFFRAQGSRWKGEDFVLINEVWITWSDSFLVLPETVTQFGYF